jgi:hypothetical protein
LTVNVSELGVRGFKEIKKIEFYEEVHALAQKEELINHAVSFMNFIE